MRSKDHHRRVAVTFLAALFVLFMLAGFLQARRDHSLQTSSSWLSFVRRSESDVTEHPIPVLIAAAKDAFARRLARQSTTLPDAVAEYKRRYGRDPPRGFDHWFHFAIKHGFMLVDEFDAINDDLAPFWSLSGEELRRRAFLMGHMPSIDLVRIKDGNVSAVEIEKAYVDNERGHRALGFRFLVEQFRDLLPDMDIPINTKAEGRVLVPWEHANGSSAADVEAMLTDFTPDWQGEGGVWDAYRRTCPPDTPARRLYSSYRNPDVERGQRPDSFMDFVESVPDVDDFCNMPWARYTQGHFFSDWRIVPMLFPVFSPAKANGFADIRIPSHYYFRGSAKYTYAWDPTSQDVKDIDDLEVPWEHKQDAIFWRGATTGGGNTPPGFTPSFQRHRFLRMTHESAPANLTVTHASPLHPDTFISTSVSAKDANKDIMDVAFVSAVGEYPGGDVELHKHHRFSDPVPLGKHWSYKYLIDLDGMSYSGRFMALLASDSAVLKSTVYEEYYSDWIQPWLHYIPVSSSYSEIYNIFAYFSGPSPSVMNATGLAVSRPAEWARVKTERDGQLRRLARAGKQWKHTIGRTIDMEVYVYRLCLEYGRLWADDRDAMGFVL